MVGLAELRVWSGRGRMRVGVDEFVDHGRTVYVRLQL